MCSGAALTHAAETTLSLIKAAAAQRRSRSARDGHAQDGEKQNYGLKYLARTNLFL